MSTTHDSATTEAGTARSRLTADQEASLSNVIASFGMEGMTFTDTELDVLAGYALGEVSREECVAQLDALNGVRSS